MSKTDEERQQVAEAHKEVWGRSSRHQRGKRGPTHASERRTALSLNDDQQ